jgi:phosphoribosyl 1,2-cyclic phosphate phosphodiesterase
METIQPMAESKGMEELLQGVLLQPMEKVQIDKYTVYPVRGVHAPGAGPLIYAISDGEKTLLYWHDSGPLPDEAFAYWKENGLRFDFVSMDCTSGCSPMNYDAHMNLERNILMRDRLKAEGLADDKTVFCCNHFSHNGANSLYDEFVEIAAKEGFITSYDGMVVEI